MNVLGYYAHKDDIEKGLDSWSVMVVIDDGEKRLICYSPNGQHSEMDREYFKECEPITKDDYIKYSYGLYTPNEYMI